MGYGYKNLFPIMGEGLPDGAGVVTSSPTSPVRADSYDPEGDTFSYETKTKNLGKLEAFARELAENISIPSAVKAIEPSGGAFLRLSRNAGGWHVITVTGDPYFRAIIYETVSSLLSTNQALQQLSAVEYKSIRIYLSFSTVYGRAQTAKPRTTNTNANMVFINFVHQHVDGKWQLAMPGKTPKGDDTVLLNLIGAIMLARDAIKNADPAESGDAKRLRLSPAFLWPVGR